MTRAQLYAEKRDLWKRMEAIRKAALDESRAHTDAEQREYDEHGARIQEIEAMLEQEARHSGFERPGNGDSRGRVLTDPDPDGDERNAIDSAEYRAAHNRYLRSGERGLRGEDRETLQAGSDRAFAENRTLSALVGQNGGYLVPTTFLNQVVETQKFFGGALQVGATVLNTSHGEDIMWPTNDDTGNEGELLGENAAVTTQDVTFGQRKLSAYMVSSKLVKSPLSLLSDSSVDVEAFLGRKFGQRIGRTKNRLITVGTGASQPQGMVTGASMGPAAVTASATAITYDELIDLEHSVDIAYRQNGKHMFADSTLALLRKLKDSTGRPLWEPSLKDGVPSTLNGRPYVINNDMPAATANNKAILFGDFEAYYIIRTVSGLLVVRLNELYALNLQVGFFAVERFDGGVQDASAVKALVMHS